MAVYEQFNQTFCGCTDSRELKWCSLQPFSREFFKKEKVLIYVTKIKNRIAPKVFNNAGWKTPFNKKFWQFWQCSFEERILMRPLIFFFVFLPPIASRAAQKNSSLVFWSVFHGVFFFLVRDGRERAGGPLRNRETPTEKLPMKKTPQITAVPSKSTLSLAEKSPGDERERRPQKTHAMLF